MQEFKAGDGASQVWQSGVSSGSSTLSIGHPTAADSVTTDAPSVPGVPGTSGTPSGSAASLFSQWAEDSHGGNRSAERQDDPPQRAVHQALENRGTGMPLDASVAEHFGAAYGADLSGVRLHTDANAAQAVAGAKAEAFTYGQDVFLGNGLANPRTPDGILILGHELAHVAQQGHRSPGDREKRSAVRPELAAIDDQHEQEADSAAASALAGERAPVSHASPKVRFFAQGDGSRLQRGHAYMTEAALKRMGLSDTSKQNQDGSVDPSETRVARMGNWERDLSQVITPTTSGLLTPIWPLLNIVSIKDFGRGINAGSFGTYDPVEHLDNPTGLRGDDVLKQGASGSTHIDGSGANYDNPAGPLSDAGRHDQAYADVDARYRAGQDKGELADGQKIRGKILNPQDAAAYQIDESAVPRYISTSRAWCINTLRHAAVLGRGRGSAGDAHLRGPHLFSSGVHVLQDYYAHSNFCEVAINILIKEGNLEVSNSEGAVQKVDRTQKLDSHVHKNDAHGNPVPANMEYAGREVVNTGTFNLTDTMASLLEEVRDKWLQLDPFAESGKGPSQVVMACLDYLEMNPKKPTDFSGLSNNVASTLNGTATAIEAIANNSGLLTSLLGRGVSLVGKGTQGLMHGTGWLLNKIGFSGAGETVSQAGDGVARSLDSAGDEVKDVPQKLRRLAAKLREVAASFQGGQHLARRIYAWLYQHNPLDALIEWMKEIPKVGPTIVSIIQTAKQSIDAVMRIPLQLAWRGVQQAGASLLSGVISKIGRKSGIAEKKKSRSKLPGVGWLQTKLGNVSDMFDPSTGKPKNGIAPTGYTPPSHTEVAKDHGDLDTAPGKHDLDGHDKDEHAGHEHESGWLYAIAEQLASQATLAAGTEVSKIWDEVDGRSVKLPADSPLLAPIDEVVRRHLAHPADCRPNWESTMRGVLKSKNIGGRMLNKLAEGRSAHGH